MPSWRAVLRLRMRELEQRFVCSLQPGAKVDGRPIPEEIVRRANVGDRVANVARAGGAVVGLEPAADDIADVSNELVERCALAARDVDDLATEDVRRRGGEQVGPDGVVDVTEVARLL